MSAGDPNLGKASGEAARRSRAARAVVIHLTDQRVYAVKLQFLAEEGDEGDVQAAAIKVALEVEQEDFQ